MNARDKYEGYGAIVRALRAAGSEVDVKTLDSVALLEAVEAGESDAVETVLAAEADAQNQGGETALIWAAKECGQGSACCGGGGGRTNTGR